MEVMNCWRQCRAEKNGNRNYKVIVGAIVEGQMQLEMNTNRFCGVVKLQEEMVAVEHGNVVLRMTTELLLLLVKMHEMELCYCCSFSWYCSVAEMDVCELEQGWSLCCRKWELYNKPAAELRQ
ncbi:hypothetical protein C5167_032772 [Papaver somniferum]|uniref:Uncharacterized protein n=1 Tax=Papaver somniferum TaxID=3469 RepID=A0A4Y7KBV4_PAPSO|nr:hypothetical protein C5167_032772 [Papaver somniferum]